ncbi:hypothetical protein C0995_016679 [Termitomyces sp. Mi166|nr:hypothetical protein C0995_016679 [Termitomyces sp. Mi166\
MRRQKRKHGHTPKNSKAKAKPISNGVGLKGFSDSNPFSEERFAHLAGQPKVSASPRAKLSVQPVHEGVLVRDSSSRSKFLTKASGPKELERHTVRSSGPYFKSEPFDETFASRFDHRPSARVDYPKLYIPRSPSPSEDPSSPGLGRLSPSVDTARSKTLRPSSSLDELILSIC